ncbi:unnamed protein product [Boreogadus saida]
MPHSSPCRICQLQRQFNSRSTSAGAAGKALVALQLPEYTAGAAGLPAAGRLRPRPDCRRSFVQSLQQCPPLELLIRWSTKSELCSDWRGVGKWENYSHYEPFCSRQRSACGLVYFRRGALRRWSLASAGGRQRGSGGRQPRATIPFSHVVVHELQGVKDKVPFPQFLLNHG